VSALAFTPIISVGVIRKGRGRSVVVQFSCNGCKLDANWKTLTAVILFSEYRVQAGVIWFLYREGLGCRSRLGDYLCCDWLCAGLEVGLGQFWRIQGGLRFWHVFPDDMWRCGGFSKQPSACHLCGHNSTSAPSMGNLMAALGWTAGEHTWVVHLHARPECCFASKVICSYAFAVLARLGVSRSGIVRE